MTNRTRTILAFLSGAAIAGLSLVIVNVFFPETMSPNMSHPIILPILIVIFAGFHTVFVTRSGSLGLLFVFLFAFASARYLETTPAILDLVFIFAIAIPNMILALTVFRHKTAPKNEATTK